MEKTSHSSNPQLSSLYGAKNTFKTSLNILDKASRIFEKEIAHKYGYKIYNFIDVKGVRFVIAERDDYFYIISLVIVVKTMCPVKGEFDDINSIIDFTKAVSHKHEAVPASSVIYIS